MGKLEMPEIAIAPSQSLAKRDPLQNSEVFNRVASPVGIKADKKAQLDRISKKLTGEGLKEESLPTVSTPERKELRAERIIDLQAKVDQIKAARGENPAVEESSCQKQESGTEEVTENHKEEVTEKRGWRCSLM